MNKPYTYLIGWNKLNTYYYGVRWGNVVAPDQDLWIEYYTSSVHVTTFIEYNGDPDIIEIRKVFDNVDSARDWEHKVLRRMKVVQSDNWLNRYDGIAIKNSAEMYAALGAATSITHKGIVSAFDLIEKKYVRISKEQFDSDKKYVGSSSYKIPLIYRKFKVKITNGVRFRKIMNYESVPDGWSVAPKEKIHDGNGVGNRKLGNVVAFDLVEKKYLFMSTEEFQSDIERYVGHLRKKIPLDQRYVTITDGKSKRRIFADDYIPPNWSILPIYIPNHLSTPKQKITVFDLQQLIYVSISTEEYYNNKERYVVNKSKQIPPEYRKVKITDGKKFKRILASEIIPEGWSLAKINLMPK